MYISYPFTLTKENNLNSWKYKIYLTQNKKMYVYISSHVQKLYNYTSPWANGFTFIIFKVVH